MIGLNLSVRAMKKLDRALQTLSPGRQDVVLGRKLSMMSPSKTKAARQRLLFPTRAQCSDALSEEIKSAVKDFYLSDRISRTLPRKKDIKSVNDELKFTKIFCWKSFQLIFILV